MEMTVVQTSGVTATDVPEDVAADLIDAYTTLAKLPSNRAVTVDFATRDEALLFVRQGNAWAKASGYAFGLRGDANTQKKITTRVMFRVWKPAAAAE